jgi:hypothetical protein
MVNCPATMWYLKIMNSVSQMLSNNFHIKYKEVSIGRKIIEKLPTITINEIIADTKWIYATYRIFGFSVKP